MNNELGRMWKAAVAALSKALTQISLDRLRKTTKKLTSQFQGQVLNHRPYKYETEVLTNQS
jgi:hypothetical protein